VDRKGESRERTELILMKMCRKAEESESRGTNTRGGEKEGLKPGVSCVCGALAYE